MCVCVCVCVYIYTYILHDTYTIVDENPIYMYMPICYIHTYANICIYICNTCNIYTNAICMYIYIYIYIYILCIYYMIPSIID